MNLIGKFLIIFGSLVVVVGIVVGFWGRIPLLGKLPGDIFLQRGSFKFYFPIMTSLILSIVLTILVNLFTRR